MRPIPGAPSGASPPPRKHSFSDPEAIPIAPSSGAPTSFFLASESDLESRHPEPGTSSPPAGATDGPSIQESTYGVRSLNDSTPGTGDAEDEGEDEEDGELEGSSQPRHGNRRRSTIRPWLAGKRDTSMDSAGMGSEASSDSSSPARNQYAAWRRADTMLSQPMTPILFPSPRMGSEAPSSPKSFSVGSRVSDDEDSDRGSQAIGSSGEEDDHRGATERVHEGEAQQFIMPSILMPSRRPFTDRGKGVGKLKVLLAGPSGVGKTSLIKSIVQMCEDIVHVDPVPSDTAGLRHSRSKTKSNLAHSNPTKLITEVYASTKPYPEWWTEPDESSLLSRRKSSGESVLERNVCFIDTPGYGRETSALGAMENTLQYLESQMSKSLSTGNLSDSELLSMLSASGGPQVDAVLYLISHDLKPTDIEYLRQLNHLTPIIPLIAKSDILPASEAESLKASIREQLQKTDIASFSFPSDSSSTPPYAICSSPSNDLEHMDASLLMQSDFLPPLAPSDLPLLLTHLLDHTNLARLKHVSAKKLLRWRSSPRASSLPSPFTTALVPSASTSPSPPIFSPAPGSPSPMALTNPRLVAHTQREERLANIRLASWAGSLQRSLAAERARYEALARADQAKWLKERMREYGEIGPSNTIDRDRPALPAPESGMTEAEKEEGWYGQILAENTHNEDGQGLRIREEVKRALERRRFDRTDPLGIVAWGEGARRRGWLALRVAGGCGVVGALAVWIVRAWGPGAAGQEWWDYVWGGWLE